MLDQFLALANSSRGRAAVELIKTVLSHSSVFVFGPLLDHENVAALEGTEHEPYLRLLRLFAYGTYDEYQAADGLPELNEQQLRKLRQVTIVSRAASTNTLRYKDLMGGLGVENVRELEDMIIDCIEAGLLFGRLDQRELVFEVEHAIGRDIGPNDVREMIDALSTWLGASQGVLRTLERKIEAAEKARHDGEAVDAERKARAEAAVAAALEADEASRAGKGKNGKGAKAAKGEAAQ